MKRILVIGATGAMGKPLLQQLCKNPEFEVYATSRSTRSDEKIHWLQGNAKESTFLTQIITENQFDAIVDYMVYSTKDFQERYEFILENTSQYIFTSSARVYAQKDDVIDEESPRILDVCENAEYLSHDSYDLAKARQEDLLRNSVHKNWTIVRPSLTYNSRRLQFTIFELEEWIYRALDHNSIIFPDEMRDIVTTMTHGNDVAKIVAKLVLNPDAIGEVFNVNGGGHRTWGEILEIYRAATELSLKEPVKICKVTNVTDITKRLNRYDQYRLARGINRVFSNNKVESVVGPVTYIAIEDGLCNCMESFLKNPGEIYVPARKGAYLDRLASEWTPLNRFRTNRQKAGYLLGRFGVIKA